MGRTNKNKSLPKTQVVFDESERAKYLLGFHKRKVERKKKAREELEDRIKQERKRQKELRAEAVLEERKKAGLPLFNNELKLTNRDVIETNDNTIIISDFSNNKWSREDDDDEEDERNEVRESEKKDAEVTNARTKMNKESSLIEEKLTKLEKQKKALEMSNTKLKKNMLKSKQSSRNSKSTKKFHLKKIKNRNKKRAANSK